ncbi:MAG: hypothetical protein L6R48_24825, partial [Planctomycetes bacterium]|nr:hypothetical protein [Planctomycetota bacterium]
QVLLDPACPDLTRAARARRHALQGRLRAVDGRIEEAEEAFATAQALIADDPGLGEAPRGRERARVACWRAMNALDGGLAGGPALLAEALGAPPVEAARALAVLHGEAAEEARSRHHLLLRSLWFNRADDDAEDAYLDLDESWGELPVQHPGELAGAYRALLLWRADEEEDVVADIFRTALAGAADEGRGPLQRLTLAAVAVAAWACIDDPAFRDLGEREIAAAEAAGPGYAEATLHLRAALAAVDELDDDADPEVVEEIADRALTALPASWR